MNSRSFLKSDKVTDPRHGFATVTFVGSDYLGLRFEQDDRQALFKIEGHRLHLGWDESVLVESESEEDEAPASLPWPESTFVASDDEERHDRGSHLEPFQEGSVQAFLKRLPAIVSEASPLGGFGQFYRPQREEPDTWVQGIHLVWPAQHHGTVLVVTLRSGTRGNELMSLYPYVERGIETPVRLEHVRIWESGVEAQIDALWGPAPVTFFDSAFLLNRGWYDAGRDYDFLLAGIAYIARPAESAPIRQAPHPDVIAWERMLAEERGEPAPKESKNIDLKGASIFMNIPDWDDDDYSFRGPVKHIEPFEDFLGQSGWKVRVTVMRFDDEDADLDVYITRRAWQGEQPLERGQDIEGQLWLQGRLWSAPQAWEPGKRKL